MCHSNWLPMEGFSEAYKMFFDKYEKLDGKKKATKEEIKKYIMELEMWKDKQEKEKDMNKARKILDNTIKFLESNNIKILRDDKEAKILEIKNSEYLKLEDVSFISQDCEKNEFIVGYKTEEGSYNGRFIFKDNIYAIIYPLFKTKYEALLETQQQTEEQSAEHQDYYINEFYKFIKQDDLVAGFENETKFIMSSDKNLSNSKIKKICLDNNELIAYFENYMFTFKDNYSLYDDFLFKFNELLNKQKGEVEKLAEFDVKDTIRKFEENTTRTSYTDFLNETFNQPTQDTTDYTIKYDQNKHKLSQFPREAMEAVAEVMEYGAKKYGGGIWSRVEAQRYVDAAARHLYAMQDIDENGKECINLAKTDEESGLEHLYHLACNVVYAVALYKRGKDETR